MPKKITKKPVAKAPAEKKAKKYLLEVSVNDLLHKEETNDLAESLNVLALSPEFPFSIKTRVFIKASKGKAEAKRTFHVQEARKVFRRVSVKPLSLSLLAEKLVEELG